MASRRLARLAAAGALFSLSAPAPAQPSVTWAQRETPVHPPARSSGSLVYDSARAVCVLFGGAYYAGGYHYLGDTWEWDGAAWSLRATTGPSPRAHFAMAYDAARRVTVLHGGCTSQAVSGVGFSDTWEWDGQVWTERTPQTVPTIGPWWPAMIFDSSRNVCLAVGNYSDLNHCSGTMWQWDGFDWSQIDAGAGPYCRCNQIMVYDSAQRRTIVAGGRGADDLYNDGGWFYHDLWEYSDQWAQRIPNMTPLNNGSAGAFDSFRSVTVIFTARENPTPSATIEYTGGGGGGGGAWTPRPIPGPSSRAGHLMCYDSARHTVILFSGSVAGSGYLDDTWELASQCPADYDADGAAAPADVSAFVSAWFISLQNGTLAGDFDGSGVVEPADLSRFVLAWFGAVTSGC